MNSMLKILSVVLSGAFLTLLGACSASSEIEIEGVDVTQCAADSSINYICGLNNAEDLLLLGDTGFVLVSGMSGADGRGHLYLVDPADDSFSELIFSDNFGLAFDQSTYAQCPGPLNVNSFSVHGLALKEYAEEQFTLYFTSHGEREAIEVINLDMRGVNPAVSWQGCVVLPENTFSNSVAILPDGGFVTTKMMDPRAGFGSVVGGEITGNVYEWHPGGQVFAIPGTELSGANGIALSADGRYMFVAAFGSREIVRFDRSMTPIGKESVSVDITPDNVRWGKAGKLLTAGGNFVDPSLCLDDECATGWSVLEIDAESLSIQRVGGADQNVAMQGISSALMVNDDYWVGTYDGDRIGYFAQ